MAHVAGPHSSNFGSTTQYDAEYSTSEKWWADHYSWLEGRGYTLRVRFSPGWVPSWRGDPARRFYCEDKQRLLVCLSHPCSIPALTLAIQQNGSIMDARKLDGTTVVLKRVHRSTHPREVELATLLSSEEFRRDPRNHCVIVHEILQSPSDSDCTLVVMPRLRPCTSPRFDTFGEVVSFMRQIFVVSSSVPRKPLCILIKLKGPGFHSRP